jgi:hypothetical protein
MSHWRGRLAGLWPVVFLIGLLWLVRYARSAEFGLYEDDLTYIPTPVQMNAAELAPATARLVLEFRQGTPLELALLDWLAYLGWALASSPLTLSVSPSSH